MASNVCTNDDNIIAELKDELKNKLKTVNKNMENSFIYQQKQI